MSKQRTAWDEHRAMMRERIVERERARKKREEQRIKDWEDARKWTQVYPTVSPLQSFSDAVKKIFERASSNLRVRF